MGEILKNEVLEVNKKRCRYKKKKENKREKVKEIEERE